MPANIACPKCQTRYQIPDNVMGKTIACKKCGTKFLAAANEGVKVGVTATAASAAPRRQAVANRRYSEGASAEALARLGLDGPIRRQADPLSDDLVPPPKDILGNYAADPGFLTPPTEVSRSRVSATKKDDELIENPYAKEIEATRKKRRQFQGEPGYEFHSVKTLEWMTRMFAWFFLGVFFLTAASWGAAFWFQDQAATWLFAGVIASIFAGLTAAVWLVLMMIFVYRVNCNLRALGTKELAFSPLMTIFCWFIPILNLFWPCRMIGELYKASHSPFGSKWKKEPFPPIVLGFWILHLLGILFISIPILMKITKTIATKQERYVQ
jgi:hypothetical protein